MLSSLICGAGSFHQEEEEEIWCDSPYSSPRKSRKKSHGSKSSKNPYSTRGLDKFTALLADLEEKRQKIYLQADSQDISFVRFVHSSSNDWKPIVVKSKDKKEARTKKEPSADLKEVKQQELQQPPQQPRPIIEEANEKAKMSGLWWNMEMGKWRRPSYYLPVAVIFILLLLLVFGRSFAILCTSLGWYAVPKLKESENTRKSTKKKEYVRGLSENKMVMISAHTKEYTRSKSGDAEGKSTRPRGHQNSW